MVSCDVRKGSWDNNKVLTYRDLSQELHEKKHENRGVGNKKELAYLPPDRELANKGGNPT